MWARLVLRKTNAALQGPATQETCFTKNLLWKECCLHKIWKLCKKIDTILKQLLCLLPSSLLQERGARGEKPIKTKNINSRLFRKLECFLELCFFVFFFWWIFFCFFCGILEFFGFPCSPGFGVVFQFFALIVQFP